MKTSTEVTLHAARLLEPIIPGATRIVRAEFGGAHCKWCGANLVFQRTPAGLVPLVCQDDGAFKRHLECPERP